MVIVCGGAGGCVMRGELHHVELWVPDLTRAIDSFGWLLTGAADDGWTLLFSDRHPHAGGPDHHAAYLEPLPGVAGVRARGLWRCQGCRVTMDIVVG